MQSKRRTDSRGALRAINSSIASCWLDGSTPAARSIESSVSRGGMAVERQRPTLLNLQYPIENIRSGMFHDLLC